MADTDLVLFDHTGRRLRRTEVAGPSLAADGHVSPWFGALMLELAEATGAKVTEARTRIYAATFAGFAPERVVVAARRARLSGKGFFPSEAEILAQILPSADDRALLAWTALERAAGAVGAYRSVELEDACAARALVQVFGSWAGFCATERGPELALRRQQFLAAYREARRQAPSDPEPVRVAGFFEATGDVARLPAAWMARLTLDGEIVHERERPALPDGAPVAAYLSPSAQQEQEQHDGEETAGPARPSGDGRPQEPSSRKRRP